MELMNKPSDETIQQIDFVIQGLENGKYKELAEQVKFHQKLKGDDDPNYFQSLIFALETAQLDVTRLEQQVNQLKIDVEDAKMDFTTEQTKVMNHEADIVRLAKAVKYLFNPNPLDKAYDLQDINQWLNNKSVY